jgi:hypothetical protein
MFVIILLGKSSSTNQSPSPCMKYFSQLNSNIHMPYEQGVRDHPLHGNFTRMFLFVKQRFDL